MMDSPGYCTWCHRPTVAKPMSFVRRFSPRGAHVWRTGDASFEKRDIFMEPIGAGLPIRGAEVSGPMSQEYATPAWSAAVAVLMLRGLSAPLPLPLTCSCDDDSNRAMNVVIPILRGWTTTTRRRGLR